MTFDVLKGLIGDFAKDQRLNLGAITRSTALKGPRLWGTVLACAAATRDEQVTSLTLAQVADELSDAERDAALGAASIMAMNNVFYRGRHFLPESYAAERVGLRMNLLGSPGVPKADFELWCLAVSAINGCGDCVGSHEASCREEGVSREEILEALRISAIMAGVAQAVMAGRAMGNPSS